MAVASVSRRPAGSEEDITRAFENIKQTVTSVAEAFSQWWQSTPDNVKEELKRYGEGNIS